MEETIFCTFCSKEIIQVKNGLKVNETTTTNRNKNSDAEKNISFWRHIYEQSVRECGEISGLTRTRWERGMNSAPTLTFKFSGRGRQEKSRYDLHKSMKMMCGECEKEFENLEQLHKELASIEKLMEFQVKKIENRYSELHEGLASGLCEGIEELPVSLEGSVFGTKNILNTLCFLTNICEGTDANENMTSKCVQVSLGTLEPDKSTDLYSTGTQYEMEETTVETTSYCQNPEAASHDRDSGVMVMPSNANPTAKKSPLSLKPFTIAEEMKVGMKDRVVALREEDHFKRLSIDAPEVDIGETKVYTEIFPDNDQTVSQNAHEIQSQSDEDNQSNSFGDDLTTRIPVVVIERLQIESNIHHDDIIDSQLEENVTFKREGNLQVDKPSSNRKVIRIVEVGTQKPHSKKKLLPPNPNGSGLSNTHGFAGKFFVGGIPKFHCKCGKIFGKRDSINKHKLRIEKGSLFKCTVENCESRFYNTFNLKRHLRSVHGKKKLESNIGCRRCGAMFKLKEDFHAHLMEHKKLQK